MDQPTPTPRRGSTPTPRRGPDPAVVGRARADIATEQALVALIEEMVLQALVAGEDYGIAHDKGCREKLAPQPFQGPGLCPQCGRKPDLRLPGAERVVMQLGSFFGEPAVAKDVMAAAAIEAPWIAFRVPVVTKCDGEVIGHGVGARTLAQSLGDPNTMMKMAKKSAIIDAAKTTFALSGFFSQDTPAAREAGPEAPDRGTADPAPAPTPANPATVPDRATPNLDGVIRACALTSADLELLYRATGWTEAQEVTEAHARGAARLVQKSFKPYIAANGGWDAAATPHARREQFFLPWARGLAPPVKASAPAAKPSAPATRPPGGPPEGLTVARAAKERTPHAPATDHPIPSGSLEHYTRAFALDTATQRRILGACGLPSDRQLGGEERLVVWRFLSRTLPKWVQAHRMDITSRTYTQMTPDERREQILVPFLDHTASAAS